MLGHRRTGRANCYFTIWQPTLADSLKAGHADLSKLLRPGDPFNAWKRFIFIRVPVSLACSPEFAPGAKLLFGLLAYHGRTTAIVRETTTISYSRRS